MAKDSKQKVQSIPGRAAVGDIVEAAKRRRAEELGEEYTPPATDEGEEEITDLDKNAESEVLHYEGEEENASPAAAGEEGVGDPADERDADVASASPPGGEEDLVTIVVDGQEQQVPRSKVYEYGMRTLQKETAADKRLAEANRRAHEIEQREALLAQRELEIQARSQKPTSGSQPSEQDVDPQTRARQIVATLLDGDEEEATKAMAELLGRTSATPGLDANRLVNEAAQQVQRQIENQAALKSFQSKYPEIANDPTLFQRADQETIRIKRERPDIGLEELLLEAGESTRKWVKSLASSPNGDPLDKGKGGRTKDKVGRKRTTENLPTAHARNPAPRDPSPPTRSDVVAQMRKQRGLPEVG